MLEILTVMPQLKQTKPGKQSVCTVFALVSQRALSIWWKIPLWISRYFRCQMEQHFLLFPEKRFIEIFANFLLGLWKFLFDFTFFPEFPIFSIEQSPFWKFYNFWIFWKPGNFPTICARLEISEFLVEWWAPKGSASKSYQISFFLFQFCPFDHGSISCGIPVHSLYGTTCRSQRSGTCTCYDQSQ